jgi:2-dehydro-3-deoxygalactonokinase
VTARDPRLDVSILPGLSQSSPCDVMRGEETQIAGLLAEQPDFDGVLCLPGTHTKWVRVSAGHITAFRTAMTGELFDLIATRSTLSAFTAEGWDDTAFDREAARALRFTGALAADLFSLRAEGLLSGHPEGAGRARLSGRLLGSEVAAMRRIWPGIPITLLGEPTLCALYARVLNADRVEAEIRDGAALTLAGLRAAHARYARDTA